MDTDASLKRISMEPKVEWKECTSAFFEIMKSHGPDERTAVPHIHLEELMHAAEVGEPRMDAVLGFEKLASLKELIATKVVKVDLTLEETLAVVDRLFIEYVAFAEGQLWLHSFGRLMILHDPSLLPEKSVLRTFLRAFSVLGSVTTELAGVAELADDEEFIGLDFGLGLRLLFPDLPPTCPAPELPPSLVPYITASLSELKNLQASIGNSHAGQSLGHLAVLLEYFIGSFAAFLGLLPRMLPLASNSISPERVRTQILPLLAATIAACDAVASERGLAARSDASTVPPSYAFSNQASDWIAAPIPARPYPVKPLAEAVKWLRDAAFDTAHFVGILSSGPDALLPGSLLDIGEACFSLPVTPSLIARSAIVTFLFQLWPSSCPVAPEPPRGPVNANPADVPEVLSPTSFPPLPSSIPADALPLGSEVLFPASYLVAGVVPTHELLLRGAAALGATWYADQFATAARIAHGATPSAPLVLPSGLAHLADLTAAYGRGVQLVARAMFMARPAGRKSLADIFEEMIKSLNYCARAAEVALPDGATRCYKHASKKAALRMQRANESCDDCRSAYLAVVVPRSLALELSARASAAFVSSGLAVKIVDPHEYVDTVFVQQYFTDVLSETASTFTWQSPSGAKAFAGVPGPASTRFAPEIPSSLCDAFIARERYNRGLLRLLSVLVSRWGGTYCSDLRSTPVMDTFCPPSTRFLLRFGPVAGVLPGEPLSIFRSRQVQLEYARRPDALKLAILDLRSAVQIAEAAIACPQPPWLHSVAKLRELVHLPPPSTTLGLAGLPVKKGKKGMKSVVIASTTSEAAATGEAAATANAVDTTASDLALVPLLATMAASVNQKIVHQLDAKRWYNDLRVARLRAIAKSATMCATTAGLLATLADEADTTALASLLSNGIVFEAAGSDALLFAVRPAPKP